MQVFTTIFVVALAAGAFAEVKCPSEQEYDWTIELILPHPDCSKFFKCTHGKPVAQSCPAGLLYNAASWQCDYPENVVCERKDIPEPAPEQEVEVPEPAEEQESVEEVIKFWPNGCPVNSYVHWLLPRWFVCSQYYSCVFGIKIERNCPKGLFFNRRLQVCDYPYRAGCFNLWPF